ncbi:MAG: hypothetical protein KBD21_02890 [Candidatus Pacebacteria bacterium]|nr:hypothetical protein [Candidatus Paceibacterota bacterium]
MFEHTKLGRRVVVKTQRKAHGGTGKNRRGQTGKIGILYVTRNGTEEEYARFTEPTFTELQRQLRATNLVPSYVTLNKTGDTLF